MKDIFRKVLEKAIPYYEKGRDRDIEHIKWLFNTISSFIDESEADFDILIPLVILHDVGYSEVPKGSNPYNPNIRKLHSEKGAEIAEKILNNLKYPVDKIKEIKRLILKHDNWAFGDSFSNEPILRIFTNFDFMWMVSKKGFDIVRRIMKQEPEEFYNQIKNFKKKNDEQGRTWYNDRIEKYYDELMIERKEEINL